MRKQSFPVTLYRDEDGWYVVECPIIPGCMSQGKTEPEALHNIREAIQLCLEVRREQGLPHTLSIPLHDELGPGLLRDQIRKAGLTIEEFITLL